MKAQRPPPSTSPGPKERLRAGLGMQSLLIVHLDGDKLREDGLHLGDAAQVTAAVTALCLGAKVVVIDTTRAADLNARLGSLAKTGQTFDVIVAIGHSHAGGIRMASDHEAVTDWPALARYLEPFRPRRLLLVACRAGRSDAGDALFAGLPHLQQIYACPVNASKDFGALMLVAVPYVVAERSPDPNMVLLAQLAAVAVTGCQLREWRRTTDSGNPDSAVLDVLADLLDPLAREVPGALLDLLGPDE